MFRFFVALFAIFLLSAQAKEKAKIPYLGPGTDVMSPEEYQRVYKNYIQLSVLLGYPFLEGEGNACDHDLRVIFRQAGFFNYPVPGDAGEVRRGKFKVAGSSVETYELGGVSIQVIRDAKSTALDRLVLVTSASPKATRKLSGFLRKEILSLQRDPRTGLERLHGLPVGFPHPLLTTESQGLFVKILTFNRSLDHCAPIAFLDNSWVGGYDLTEDTCRELQGHVEQVWHGQLSAKDFADAEVLRLKERALKSAMSHGLKREDAMAIVNRNFVEPFTSQVNVVGTAMRNLAQCNALAFGHGGNTSAPQTPHEGVHGKGAGSAQ